MTTLIRFATRNMKLHLGSFNQPADGWHNTDITPHIFVSRIPLAAPLLHLLGKMTDERMNEHRSGVFRKVHFLNVAKRFPFKDASVEAVFSSHIIEHLSPSVAEHMLRESLRVLEPGGVCRVVAPSLDLAVASYKEESPEAMLEMVFEHDHKSPKNRHQWMYTGPSLVRLMKKVGFAEATEMNFREGKLPDLQLVDNRPENSIYVEAIKSE